MVSVALVLQLCANWSALIPAMDANESSASPPVATALSMDATVLENAVPPASASMPREDMAPDHPRISGVLMPTWLDAAAMRCPMDETLDSVVARLLPRLTMAEP